MTARSPSTGTTIRRWALLLAALLFSLGLVEVALRGWDRGIATSDRMDPGLVRPDPALGWTLTPSWRGQHRHLDFDVRYAVDVAGFREDPHAPGSRRGRCVAVLGDSFTFGLGVSDGDTFVALLNRDTTNTWWNFGVPGYSTDQECLQLEREVLRKKPDLVVMVHYLGNDVLDNPRPVPIQVKASKPYFRVEGGVLRLENSPVPAEVPPGTVVAGDLLSAVLEPGTTRDWKMRLGEKSALLRRIVGLAKPPEIRAALEANLSDELALSDLLVRRAAELVRKAGASFTLVLLPGKSWVESPRSMSAQYQEFLRVRVGEDARKAGVTVLDLGPILRTAYEEARRRLYHPHEGHLTVEGHAVVATAVASAERTWPKP